MVEITVGLLLALIIAFVYSWVLTLVILVVVPIVMVAGTAEVVALQGNAQKTKKALETAGKVYTYIYIYIYSTN